MIRIGMKRSLLIFIICIALTPVSSQTLNVLFLGNSYTYYNNLPQMVADMAASTGDTLIFDSNTMGGATFSAHSLNTTSLNKIMAGNWDYVILQGQSLELWGNPPNVLTSYPQVVLLDSLINQYSPCGETMFYRTWGRKNGFGGTSYQELDSIIHSNYMKLADSLDAVVSPVGEVWKYIRQQYPNIELYAPDESHPSVSGTYAAACTFYAALFRKNPTLITFNSILSGTDAANIKNAAKLVVYDSLLNWHITEYDSIINANCNSLSIEEFNSAEILVYPNPVTDQITIELPGQNSSEHIIEIFSMTGQLFRRIRTNTSIVQLKTDDLSSGIYTLLITDGSGLRSAKRFIRSESKDH